MHARTLSINLPRVYQLRGTRTGECVAAVQHSPDPLLPLTLLSTGLVCYLYTQRHSILRTGGSAGDFVMLSASSRQFHSSAHADERPLQLTLLGVISVLLTEHERALFVVAFSPRALCAHDALPLGSAFADA